MQMFLSKFDYTTIRLTDRLHLLRRRRRRRLFAQLHSQMCLRKRTRECLMQDFHIHIVSSLEPGVSGESVQSCEDTMLEDTQ